MAEKKPEWKLYYDLQGEAKMMQRDHWTKVIDD
jgi:hypothetical protein